MLRTVFCLLILALCVDRAAQAQDLTPYPRTLNGLRTELQKIQAAQLGDEAWAKPEQLAAVRRLNAYRFLCGVPADVGLDQEQTRYAQAGAELLAKIGRLEHQPENPGLPEEEYQTGYRGTSNSNIFWATPDSSPRSAVDFFMNDSDERNVVRLGHRRWCLNPAMLTTGFGHSGVYVCMWSMDRSRREIPDWQIIAYPCRGYMPVSYFSPDRAWSVSVNPRHLTEPSAESEVRVLPLARGGAAGEPLELEAKSFNNDRMGPANVLIFRPKNLDTSSGRTYRVDITTPIAGRDPAKLSYVVEFVDLSNGSRR